jgi:hypothetical protein
MRKTIILLLLFAGSHSIAQKVELLNGGNKYQLKRKADTTVVSFRLFEIPIGKNTTVTVEGIDAEGCMKNGIDYIFKVVNINDPQKLDYAPTRKIPLGEERHGSFILFFEKQNDDFSGITKLKFTIEQDGKIIGPAETNIEVSGAKAKEIEPAVAVEEKKDSMELELLNKNNVQLYSDKECKTIISKNGTINLRKINAYKTDVNKYALYVYTADNKIFSATDVELTDANGIIKNFNSIILESSNNTYIRLSDIAAASVSNNEIELSKKNQKIKIPLPDKPAPKKMPAAQPKQQ